MIPLPVQEPWLGGRLRLHQPPRGAHRAGTDAILLAALCQPEPDACVVDVGASTGAVGLALALRCPSIRVLLVEKDAVLAGLARANAAENDLAGRVEVIEADILAGGAARRMAGLMSGHATHCLTNPPFFAAGRHRPSPDPGKSGAHGFVDGDLEGWIRACVDVLAAHGRFGMIHRADALPDCLVAIGGRFGRIRVRPVQPRAGQPATRVLVDAVKGSRAPFELLPPLVLHAADGCFTPEAEALHRGEAVLEQ